MFSRDNLVGIVLVGLCGVSATALLIEIFTDYSFQYSGPQWLAGIIVLGGTGLVMIMSFSTLKRRFGRHGGPSAPRGGPSWPQDDLPGRVNWPKASNTTVSSHPPASVTAPKPDDTEEQSSNGPA